MPNTITKAGEVQQARATEIPRRLEPVTRDTFIDDLPDSRLNKAADPATTPAVVDLLELVAAARRGDSWAWTALVRRFQGRLRGVARSYRLPPADVDDVVQEVWVDLLSDIHRIREPAAIAAWLITTTRRRSMRVLQARMRGADDLTAGDVGEAPQQAGPEASALAGERRSVLGEALATLPERHRRIMVLMLAEPTLDYEGVGKALGVPVGSIGPIRARCLTRLSRDPRLRALCD
jgi:RNA polymerase sigma factor (sigma-70 family)